MLRERLVWVVALLIAAAIGFVGGQQVGSANGRQERNQASQTFFNQRGGQPGAGGQQAACGQNRPGGFAGRGLIGTVESIGDGTLTITGRDGTKTTIKIGADTRIQHQVDATLSDIKTGDRVVAQGTQNGTVFEATSLQVGAFGGAGTPRAP